MGITPFLSLIVIQPENGLALAVFLAQHRVSSFSRASSTRRRHFLVLRQKSSQAQAHFQVERL
jgi:hypothetical protein